MGHPFVLRAKKKQAPPLLAGAEALLILFALRGAEAPLFHGGSRTRRFSRNRSDP